MYNEEFSQWETSVYRTSKLSNNTIWQISKDHIEPLRKKQTKARSDIFIEKVLEHKLEVMAETSTHHLHAVIQKWGSEEVKFRAIAIALAKESTIKFPT